LFLTHSLTIIILKSVVFAIPWQLSCQHNVINLRIIISQIACITLHLPVD